MSAPAPQLVPWSTIRKAAETAGIPSDSIVEPSDARYAPMNSEWLRLEFHRYFARTMAILYERPFEKLYHAEDVDCDDFADLFAALARVAHRRTMARDFPDLKAALPIGRFNFWPNNEGKHAICWAYSSDRGLIFPEPQVIGKFIDMHSILALTCTRFSD